MSSQYDNILSLTEQGWRPFNGKVAPEVYVTLGCPAPLFAKWLYEGKEGLEAACVGCAASAGHPNLKASLQSPTDLRPFTAATMGIIHSGPLKWLSESHY